MVSKLFTSAVDIVQNEGLVELSHATKQFIQHKSRLKKNELNTKLDRIRYTEGYPSPQRLIHVNPATIAYYQLESSETDYNYREVKDKGVLHLYEAEKAAFRPRVNAGRILGGDWDKKKRDWEYHALYNSLKRIYLDCHEWEETEFFKCCLERIEKGHSSYGYDTRKSFLTNRIAYVESLRESMNREGYLTQSQAPSDHRNKDIFHEIGVNIGREGELIFNNRNGQHRLSLAKLLGIDEIPVIVIVRHKEWQDLRREIHLAEAVGELSSRSRTHIHHPDLRDVVANEHITE